METKYIIGGALVIAYLGYIWGATSTLIGLRGRMCTDTLSFGTQTASFIAQCPNPNPGMFADYYYNSGNNILDQFLAGSVNGLYRSRASP